MSKVMATPMRVHSPVPTPMETEIVFLSDKLAVRLLTITGQHVYFPSTFSILFLKDDVMDL